MKKMLVLLMLAVLLTACSNTPASTGEEQKKAEEETKETTYKQNENQDKKGEAEEAKEETKDETKEADHKEKGEQEMTFTQLEAPKPGEELAVLHTNMGDITFRLFPEVAPKAVENFKQHIKDGYYNGIIFHRVIEDFMIQGGDPTGTGRGGESIWGAPFEDEFSVYHRNIRGALSMANAGPNTNGSQFFIVHEPLVDQSILNQMKRAGEEDYPAAVVDAYKEYGGAFWLDFKHTVFGQVWQGYEVVDAIAKVGTDDADKPLKDVVIESAEIIIAK